MRDTSEAGVLVKHRKNGSCWIFIFLVWELHDCAKDTHTHIYFLKIIVLFKLDKENPIQFCFQNQNISLFVFIFIEFQG